MKLKHIAAYCAGVITWLVFDWVHPGAQTFWSTVPLLWAWAVVSQCAGAAFADGHPWISYLGASLIHGAVVLTLFAAVDRLATRRSGVPPAMVITGVGVCYLLVLSLFPASG